MDIRIGWADGMIRRLRQATARKTPHGPDPVPTCQSVCMFLGPYRNLTTLTAGILFLHPNCQVLNHGSAAVFGKQSDFLRKFSSDRLDRFVSHAVALSSRTRRGRHGGSILSSHAFDRGQPLGSLVDAAGVEVVKKEIHCLVWKEPHRLTNHMFDHGIDPGHIVSSDSRMRFLMPVRNPLDCAASNLRTGRVREFRYLGNGATVEQIAIEILKELHWFASLQQRFPDKFLHYFEHSIPDGVPESLIDFLGLDRDEAWLRLAARYMTTSSHYIHHPGLVREYSAAVRDIFSDVPEMRAGLLRFVEPSEA